MQEKILKIRDLIETHLPLANFDCAAVGLIDFKNKNFETLEFVQNEFFDVESLYFDIASMTKPLTLGVSYLVDEKKFSDDMKLLLHHQSGLPRWGRLDKESWRQQIASYKIQKSETVYSDFGALRLQLEIEKAFNDSLYNITSPFWDQEVKHWSEVEGEICAFTGRRNRHIIHGEVHDDNAFVIGEKIGHAGLFATISGVCKSLLNLDEKLNLLARVGIDHNGRYILGWDSVENVESTLAGSNASKNTFGHLGFTGTQMWIDPVKKLGHVFLTNEVNKFWYDRALLNKLRREIGSILFHD